MKKTFLLIALIIPFIFQACKNKEEERETIWQTIGTVENPDSTYLFYFTDDDGLRFKVTESNLAGNVRIKDGQRVIAYFTILSDKDASSGYNHDVKLHDVYKILTKQIFKITPETQDSIGNDPISIYDMWIGSDYLNIDFDLYYYNKTHLLNLVSDDSKSYTDGKVHLEFRHNAYNDVPYTMNRGIASFDLRSIQSAANDSVNIVVHTLEYNSTAEKTYEFTYKYGTTASPSPVRQLSFDVNKFTEFK